MNQEAILFTVSTVDMVVGIRIDRISSYRYDVASKSLTIRYTDEQEVEKFEGPVAEALARELRYGGRK